MNDKHNPLEHATFHDPRLEYQEEQERKRLAFEAEQERKRQTFELKLERQKARREIMMLIITIAAVGAAFWTGWEARHARIEAAQTADRLLQVQQAAMQLDERPYVNFTSGRWKTLLMPTFGSKPPRVGAYMSLDIIVIGKTAALDLEQRTHCEIVEPGADTNYPPLLRQRMQLAPIATPSAQFRVTCQLPVDNRARVLRMVIEISYRDLFSETIHTTAMCFTSYGSLSAHPKLGEGGNLTLCPEYPIKVT